MRAYTIRDLQQTTGLPRTTIHFYLRQGLLPRAQKTAASRSLYTDEHVAILLAIAELKEQGRTLAEIEERLQARLDEANESTVDLAAQERLAVHDRIVEEATREFIANGYKNTHVTAIMRRLGITATLFYSHFPSKRRLLAECVAASIAWSTAYADEKEAQAADPAERLLWDLHGHTESFALASSALAVMRVEGADDEDGLQGLMHEALATEVDRITRALDPAGPGGARPSRIPADLLALNLFASYQPLSLPPLGREYSRREVLEARLWLFLAAQAARNGEVDIDARVAAYDGLLSRLAAEPAPAVPAAAAAPVPPPAPAAGGPALE